MSDLLLELLGSQSKSLERSEPQNGQDFEEVWHDMDFEETL